MYFDQLAECDSLMLDDELLQLLSIIIQVLQQVFIIITIKMGNSASGQNCERCDQLVCFCVCNSIIVEDNNSLKPGGAANNRSNNYKIFNKEPYQHHENQTYQKQRTLSKKPNDSAAPTNFLPPPVEVKRVDWTLMEKLNQYNARLCNLMGKLEADLNHQSREYDKLVGKIGLIKKEYTNISQQLEKRKKVSIQINNKLEAKESQYSSFKLRNSSIQNEQKQKHKYFQAQLKKRQTQINNLNDQLINFEKIIKSLQKQRNELKYQVKIMSDQLMYITTNVDTKKKNLAEMESQKPNLEKRIQQISQRLRIKQAKLRELDHKKQAQISENQNFQRGISQIQKQKRQLSIPKPGVNSRSYTQYFAGDVLDGDDDIKEYIITFLERRLGAKIESTRLVYSYDSLSNTNIHQYIDNKDNLVLIIRLENGCLVGAWNEGAFSRKMASDRDAVIFSFSNRIGFEPLQRNKRAICYDEYFVIYGNSELRLKSEQQIVFSNLGISNEFKRINCQMVNKLFGGIQREVELKSYEFFQLQKFK